MNKLLIICLVAVAVHAAVLDLDTAREEILGRHNFYRAKHQVGNLVRESGIETIAQAYSDKLLSTGRLTHSSNEYNSQQLGENLYVGYNVGSIGTAAVDVWYAENINYDYNNPGFYSNTGHFTQVVWKGSKKLGCGVSCDSKSKCYVCCNYLPAGNYLNQFPKNVFPDNGEEPDTTTTTTKPDTTAPDTTAPDTTTPGTTTVTNVDLETFRADALTRHNYYRNQHQVGNLLRDTTLERIAQENAEYMIQTKSFHFTEEKYNGNYIGENLFSSTNMDPDGAKATDKWYAGVSSYDFNNPGYNSSAGGFTQVVWKNTQKIGCGYACEAQKCYMSCVYYPSGNYNGQFAANVFPKK